MLPGVDLNPPVSIGSQEWETPRQQKILRDRSQVSMYRSVLLNPDQFLTDVRQRAAERESLSEHRRRSAAQLEAKIESLRLHVATIPITQLDISGHVRKIHQQHVRLAQGAIEGFLVQEGRSRAQILAAERREANSIVTALGAVGDHMCAQHVPTAVRSYQDESAAIRSQLELVNDSVRRKYLALQHLCALAEIEARFRLEAEFHTELAAIARGALQPIPLTGDSQVVETDRLDLAPTLTSALRRRNELRAELTGLNDPLPSTTGTVSLELRAAQLESSLEQTRTECETLREAIRARPPRATNGLGFLEQQVVNLSNALANARQHLETSSFDEFGQLLRRVHHAKYQLRQADAARTCSFGLRSEKHLQLAAVQSARLSRVDEHSRLKAHADALRSALFDQQSR